MVVMADPQELPGESNDCMPRNLRPFHLTKNQLIDFTCSRCWPDDVVCLQHRLRMNSKPKTLQAREYAQCNVTPHSPILTFCSDGLYIHINYHVRDDMPAERNACSFQDGGAYE